MRYFMIGALFCILACGESYPYSGSLSQPNTDLGPRGNQWVASTYEKYREKAGGCHGVTRHPRAILSGFGLFEGIDYNISGVVVGSMGDATFLGPRYSTNGSSSTVLQGGFPAAGRLREDDHGGRATVRVLSINGRPYEVCFLTLSVLWDLAAAIIVHEADRFAPDFIMMTGLGGEEAVFEAGARNHAVPVPGYRHSGEPDSANQPVASPILPPDAVGVESTIAMSWDNERLLAATARLINRLGFKALAAEDARYDNDYICNNVSYVVLHAAKNVPLRLAGGELILQPRLNGAPAIGFMHLPNAARRDEASVAAWARIMATAIDMTLR